MINCEREDEKLDATFSTLNCKKIIVIVIVNEKLNFKLRENNRDQLSQLRRERRSLASVNCPYLKRRYLRDGLEEEEERLEEK